VKIRYMNCMGTVTEETAVASGMFGGGYYVLRGAALCKISRDMIISECHENGADWPPGVVEFIEGYDGELTLGEEITVGSRAVN